ncbi:Protein of unknown function [Gryllus bimaculatus]|nr:Protein of unknown function [Gryllus bimaculatus]
MSVISSTLTGQLITSAKDNVNKADTESDHVNTQTGQAQQQSPQLMEVLRQLLEQPPMISHPEPTVTAQGDQQSGVCASILLSRKIHNLPRAYDFKHTFYPFFKLLGMKIEVQAVVN